MKYLFQTVLLLAIAWSAFCLTRCISTPETPKGDDIETQIAKANEQLKQRNEQLKAKIARNDTVIFEMEKQHRELKSALKNLQAIQKRLNHE